MTPELDRFLRWVLWPTAVVYVLSLLAAAVAPQPLKDAPTPVVTPTPTPPPADFTAFRGMAINLHHTTQLERYLESIDQIAAAGFDSLLLVTPAFQRDGTDDQVRVEIGPGRGPTRKQVLDLLQHARSRGLRTMLMPVVLFTHPRGNEWRGKISPQQWDPWWRSYLSMTDYFLTIANEAEVDIFSVGSELLSTEQQTERWRQLVQHVRGRFRGRIIYSTNWDHYQVPALWRDVDLIGISGYWNLEQGAKRTPPGDDDLSRRWAQIRRELLDYASQQGKPIVITELGYPSLPWALREPWNYLNPKGAASDPATQARGYRSFLAAFHDALDGSEGARFAGVFFYAWDPYHAGGTHDTGYGVRGKQAMQVLTRWLGTGAMTNDEARMDESSSDD